MLFNINFPVMMHHIGIEKNKFGKANLGSTRIQPLRPQPGRRYDAFDSSPLKSAGSEYSAPPTANSCPLAVC